MNARARGARAAQHAQHGQARKLASSGRQANVNASAMTARPERPQRSAVLRPRCTLRRAGARGVVYGHARRQTWRALSDPDASYAGRRPTQTQISQIHLTETPVGSRARGDRLQAGRRKPAAPAGGRTETPRAPGAAIGWAARRPGTQRTPCTKDGRRVPGPTNTAAVTMSARLRGVTWAARCMGCGLWAGWRLGVGQARDDSR